MDRASSRSPPIRGGSSTGGLPTIVPQPTTTLPRSRPHSPRPPGRGGGGGAQPPPPLSLPTPGGGGATILSSASLAAMGMGSVMGVAGQQQRSGRNPTSMGGAVLPQLDLPPEDTEDAERDLLNSETDIEGELLGQLQELHRQLAELRQQSNREERERQLYDTSSKLIVCALHKPVRLVRPKDGDPASAAAARHGGQWAYEEYKGRFRSAIDSLSTTNKVRWVSWPGAAVDLGAQEAVRRRLDQEYSCTPVFLSAGVADAYYNKFCHGVLWPLFHCINTNFFNEGLLESFMEQYEAYAHANQCYLEVVADTFEQGDLVLVLDYELMLLPSLLRKRFPDVVCGFFLHCPFPSSEFYRMLPVRQQLLQGILGADLVSFNHFDYVRHFLNSCTRILGLESFPSRVEHNGRLVSLSICPAGIQPEDYEITPEVARHMETLSARYEDKKVIVSVDRLDVCKGLPQKLMAFDALLENYPEWRGQVVMFVIFRDRTRAFTEDRSLGRTVDGLVGRVNGRYGHTDYCPVKYVKGHLTNEEVIALNALADVKLVTSIREGINLGAMEFIACQQQTRHGVLVYSEFAGCSTDFKGALIINPYDSDKVAESIHVALTMSSTTKQIRNHQLSRYVNTYTSALWARRMISSLQQAGEKAREYNKLQRLDLPYLQAFYERSRRRLLIFDYDGTLVPYHSLPQLAQPPPELIAALEALCDDPANLVFVISGRCKDDLQEWLGEIPNLGLLAENGYWCRIPSELYVRAHGPVAAASLPSHHSHHGSHLSLYTDYTSTGGATYVGGLDASRTAGTTTTTAAAGAAASSPLGPTAASSAPVSMPTPLVEEADSPAPTGTGAPLSSSAGRTAGGELGGFSLDVFASNASGASINLNVFSSVDGAGGGAGGPVLSWDGWVSKGSHIDLSWKAEVMDIFESFTERTPGSFLELKDSCLSWHYRDADPDFGVSQAKNLHQHLDQMLKHRPVRVITCPVKKYIVVHPSRLNKGRALVQLLQDFGSPLPTAPTSTGGPLGTGSSQPPSSSFATATSAFSSQPGIIPPPTSGTPETGPVPHPPSSPMPPSFGGGGEPLEPLPTATTSSASASVVSAEANVASNPGGALTQGGVDLLDFVLVAGDERTDEDMFDVLRGSTAFAVLRSHHISKFVPGTPSRGHCFTVTVGRKISRAQYFVEDPKEVRRVLETLAERSQILSMLTPTPLQQPPVPPPSTHALHMPPHQFMSSGGLSSGSGGLSSGSVGVSGSVAASGGGGMHQRELSATSLASLATTALSSTSGTAGVGPTVTTPRGGGGGGGGVGAMQPPPPPPPVAQQVQAQQQAQAAQAQQQFGSVSGSEEYQQRYHHGAGV